MLGLVAAGTGLALRQSGMFAIQAIPLEWRQRLDHGKMEVEIARSIEADIGRYVPAVRQNPVLPRSGVFEYPILVFLIARQGKRIEAQ